MHHDITRTNTQPLEGGSHRHLAPELLSGVTFRTTPATDCYALSMTILELWTGAHPYQEVVNDFLVLARVLEGKRPTRPGFVADGEGEVVWNLMETMWDPDPQRRPCITDVTPRLEEVQEQLQHRSRNSFISSASPPSRSSTPRPRGHRYTR